MKTILLKTRIVWICAFIGALLGVALAIFATKEYTSTVSVLFASDSSSDGLLGGLKKGMAEDGELGIPSFGIQPGRVPTKDLAFAVLTSRGASKYVSDTLNLPSQLKLPKAPDRAIDKIIRNHIVCRRQKGGLLTFSATAPAPDLAQKMVFSYLQYYRSYSDRVSLTSTKKTRVFIEERLKDGEEKLKTSEQKLALFEKLEGASALQSEPAIQQQMFKDLFGTRLEAEGKHSAALARVQELQAKMQDVSTYTRSNPLSVAPSDDPVLSGTQKLLVEARIELERARFGKTEMHPEVVAAKAKVDAVEAQVQNRIQTVSQGLTSGLSEGLISAQAEVGATEAALAVVQEREQQVRRTLKNGPSIALENLRLRRQLALQSEVHKTLQVEYTRARIRESQESTSLEVLDPPEVPTFHSWPRKSNFAIFGGLLGSIVGVVLLFFRRTG